MINGLFSTIPGNGLNSQSHSCLTVGLLTSPGTPAQDPYVENPHSLSKDPEGLNEGLMSCKYFVRII